MTESRDGVWRPVIFWVAIICVVCFIPVIGAYFFLTSFTPRPSPFANEPSLLFDINASDYGEGMRIVPLSGDAVRSTLHEPGSSVTYVGMSDGASSVIVALDAATAEVRWDARLTDSRPRCVPYGPELRCSTGGELVGISESDGTTTVLTALPSDDYRVSKNQEERITYLLPPVDGRSQDYQVMWIDERDRVVILPWSPPPTPCAEASGTSFKDVDPHTGVGDHDLLAAVVVDGWMVLSAVDTGEIVDQRFGDLRERTGESGPLLSGDEACGSEWSQVDVSYPPPHRTVFSVVPLPAEKVPTSPPADEARPVLWRNGGRTRWCVTPDGEFGEWREGSMWTYDVVDLRGSRVENAFTDGIEVGEGAVAGTTMGGLSEKSDEYWVMVSGGGMVSVRKNGEGEDRHKIVWSADIGDDEWEARGGAVMTRDSDGRVTARSIDSGRRLWDLDTPGEMHWEENSGEPRGSVDSNPVLILTADSRILMYGHRG